MAAAAEQAPEHASPVRGVPGQADGQAPGPATGAGGDADPGETAEWLESLDALVREQGAERAGFVLGRLLERARGQRVETPAGTPGSTPYVNTVSADDEPELAGDAAIEARITAYARWNAAVQVTRANRPGIGVGGHIASYASSAVLYEVGFQHFFRGKDGDGSSGDQVFFQGHASPGMYARAYLEGRLDEDDMDSFRQELSAPKGRGLPSYPHPRLFPEFWEFPTVSMGLGPINAIYQARFNRYLTARGLKDVSDSHVWAFLGDGEMDEVESLGALGVAAREGLDNLTFVVNCNLQRLDGPVRGNGKIVQELESYFAGAGWNVVKVLWGGEWDELLARDTGGELAQALLDTPDGQMQTYSVESGAYTREHLFGRSDALRAMVADLSDDQVRDLIRARGGHDPRKVHAAYRAAVEHRGAPTVVLAHTVKGWALGTGFEARNATHQMKKLSASDLKTMRTLLDLPVTDERLDADYPPYLRFAPGSAEAEYLRERRQELGGPLPKRVVRAEPLPEPAQRPFDDLLKGSGKQQVATTMAVVRLFKDLVRDKGLGRHIVPVIPDEARTFGLDALFPTAKIYSPHGQLYDAVDRELLLSYKESTTGQVLHEGISEAGSMASTTAAGTSYATHGVPMVPLYIFYSMFGFQRTGDAMWAFADQMGRGFILGATAGRTTLNGEGLQHEDGHSPLLAATNPGCVHYDPAFAYELSHIVRDGLRRMYGPDAENVFYYLTVYNEPISQPAQPDGVDVDGLLKGLYLYQSAHSGPGDERPRAQLFASGSAMPWAVEAQRLLAEDWWVRADVWSATSWIELRREALACDEHNLLHPEESARVPFVTRALQDAQGPVVAVSDYMQQVPDQIRPWVPSDYTTLGTDGFGRSDTRGALRRHFKVDAQSIVVATLASLARRGEVKPEVVREAIDKYQLLDVRAAGAGNTAGDS